MHNIIRNFINKIIHLFVELCPINSCDCQVCHTRNIKSNYYNRLQIVYLQYSDSILAERREQPTLPFVKSKTLLRMHRCMCNNIYISPSYLACINMLYFMILRYYVMLEISRIQTRLIKKYLERKSSNLILHFNLI